MERKLESLVNRLVVHTMIWTAFPVGTLILLVPDNPAWAIAIAFELIVGFLFITDITADIIAHFRNSIAAIGPP